MGKTVLVLGAGMVGTCTALHLHLQRRGVDVTLIDRREHGEVTSYGNAGLIQREAVEPYAFPCELNFVLRAALGRGAEVHWHARGLRQMAIPLIQYFHHSRPAAHAHATQSYSRLIAYAIKEHAPLIAAAQAEQLVQRDGFRFVFRTPRAFAEAVERAQRLQDQFNVRFTAEDGAALSRSEPTLRQGLTGAVHWRDPWAVQDPGALVQRYAALFAARGGASCVAMRRHCGQAVRDGRSRAKATASKPNRP